MKIVFEFKNRETTIVHDVIYSKINEKTAQNHLIDELLSDPNLVQIYLIANDNRVVP